MCRKIKTDKISMVIFLFWTLPIHPELHCFLPENAGGVYTIFLFTKKLTKPPDLLFVCIKKPSNLRKPRLTWNFIELAGDREA